MISSITKYGLWHIEKQELLGFETEGTRGDNCVGTIYTLEVGMDSNQWLVEEQIDAEYVRKFSTEWFNARYSTPKHDFKPEELQVVMVIQNIQRTDEMVIPTFEEYIKAKYAKKDTRHYEHLLNEKDKFTRDGHAPYSLYDLHELMRENAKEQQNWEAEANDLKRKEQMEETKMSEFDDYCTECKEGIKDEDYIQVSESRGEFWGAPCSEMVVIGYKCKNCGHEEEF